VPDWLGPIAQELKSRIVNGTRTVILAECYPGVDPDEVRAGLNRLVAADATAIFAESALKPPDELARLLAPWLATIRCSAQ